MSFLASLQFTDPLKGIWQCVNISAFEFACKTFPFPDQTLYSFAKHLRYHKFPWETLHLCAKLLHSTAVSLTKPVMEIIWGGRKNYILMQFFLEAQKKANLKALNLLLLFLALHIFSISCINLTSIYIKIWLIKMCKLQSKI